MHSTRDIHSQPDTAGRGVRLISAVSLPRMLLAASFAAVSLAPATAQQAAPTQQAAVASPDIIKQREQELEAAREQQRHQLGTAGQAADVGGRDHAERYFRYAKLPQG